MNEEPFFFAQGTERLFGIFHAAGLRSARRGFVFCHPFMEEKLWTHRVYVSFARALARRGHPVLRFDCRGHGDSDGPFEESSIMSRLADIETAIAELRERTGDVGEVGLFGLRLGATLAALTAERMSSMGPLILWEPIVDGAAYMQEVLRSNLTTQLAVYGRVETNRKELVAMLERGETVTVDGYGIRHGLFFEASAINLASEQKSYEGQCLIAQIGKAGQSPKPQLEKLRRQYASPKLVCVEEEPFWREIRRLYCVAENLGEATMQWLDEIDE